MGSHPPSSSTNIVVSIGSVPTTDDPSQEKTDPTFSSNQNRLVIEDTPTGREIIDQSSRQHLALAHHAALLTITNGAQRSIRIDGTDDAAIGSLIQMLCQRDTFPEELADSLQNGTVTQVVFPMTPHAEMMVFHEPLSVASTEIAQSK